MADTETVAYVNEYYVWEDSYDEGPAGAKAAGEGTDRPGAGDIDDSDDDQAGLVSGNFANVVDVDEGRVMHKGAILLGSQRYIQKGSCVFLNSTNQKPEIGIVNSLFEAKGKAMVNVTYVFREEEIPGRALRTEGARRVELAAQSSAPETVFKVTPGRRYVYITSHKEDRDITDVYFLGTAKGEPCVEMVFNGQKVNRPRPGLICRLFYDGAPDINTVYSLEDDYDEFLDNERAEIEEAMRGTSEFMRQHRPRIMLGTPQPVPKRLSQAKRVEQAATGVASLIRSDKLRGVSSNDLLDVDSENADVALFAGHLMELRLSIAVATDPKKLDVIKSIKGQPGFGLKVYELGNAVPMPSDEACMRVFAAIQEMDEKRPAHQAMRDSHMWRVLMLWLFRIKKSKLASSGDHKDTKTWHALLISLLRALKALPPTRQDLAWAAIVRHISMKAIRDLDESWLQGQRQRHPQIQKIPQRIYEEAQALRENYLAMAWANKQKPPADPSAPGTSSRQEEPPPTSEAGPSRATLLPTQVAAPVKTTAETTGEPRPSSALACVQGSHAKPPGAAVAHDFSSDDDLSLVGLPTARAAARQATTVMSKNPVRLVTLQEPEFAGMVMVNGKYRVKYRPRADPDATAYKGLGTYNSYDEAKNALRAAVVDDAKKITGKPEGPDVTCKVDHLWEELKNNKRKRRVTGNEADQTSKKPKAG